MFLYQLLPLLLFRTSFPFMKAAKMEVGDFDDLLSFVLVCFNGELGVELVWES